MEHFMLILLSVFQDNIECILEIENWNSHFWWGGFPDKYGNMFDKTELRRCMLLEKSYLHDLFSSNSLNVLTVLGSASMLQLNIICKILHFITMGEIPLSKEAIRKLTSSKRANFMSKTLVHPFICLFSVQKCSLVIFSDETRQNKSSVCTEIEWKNLTPFAFFTISLYSTLYKLFDTI